MSGASSFVLSLLGFGTAGAVHVGQTIRQKQAEAEVGAMHGYEGTPEVLEMRSKVRKEWWRVCGNVYNACGKPVDAYGNPWKQGCYVKKRWFIAHLEEIGMPYDEIVVNDVTGVAHYEWMKRQPIW